MQTTEDLFVIRIRSAADRAQVHAENAVRLGRGPGRPSAGRAWLGRRLIAAGTFLASEPGLRRRSIRGRPG
jgi:hypothetical protein